MNASQCTESDKDVVRCESIKLTIRVRRLPRVLDIILIIFSWISGWGELYFTGRLEGRIDGYPWHKLTRWMHLPAARSLLSANCEKLNQYGLAIWVEDIASDELRGEIRAFLKRQV